MGAVRGRQLAKDSLGILFRGRWAEWNGLSPDCSLAALQDAFGGSTVLDAADQRGSRQIDCVRSSLNEVPALVWHERDTVFIVECDLLSEPRPAPPFDVQTMHKLDVTWGFGDIEGGEWVVPGRGLALVVTPSGIVVASLGFEPTSLRHYIETLRPGRGRSLPLPAAMASRLGGTQ